jgi:hypothetical protein
MDKIEAYSWRRMNLFAASIGFMTDRLCLFFASIQGLTDYPAIIKQPMDLGTIIDRIDKRNHYKSVYEVNDDVRLVWSNCMTYNADGSDFYRLAESLKKKWEDKFQKTVQDMMAAKGLTAEAAGVSGSAGMAKAPLQDKRNFAKALYQISKEDLGKLLVEVETRHPAALKRNAAEDEVELNVDEIPAYLLDDLTKFVNQ